MDYGSHLVKLVDSAFAEKNKEDGMRTHLGGSIIGKKCMREIWFSFRWADWEHFEGRMLRLFNRGNKAEDTFKELLEGIGAKVWTKDVKGKQFTVSAFNGHVGGSMDGVAHSLPGLPHELPLHTPVLLEMKTHNDKYFKELKKKGLQDAKPTHYKQAQIYMHLAHIGWCLYCAVNKNTDEVWFDLFPVDHTVGVHLLNRAETIIFGEGMPPRISETPTWFECTFCPMKGVCFGYSRPQLNCRTCKFSKPERDGTWSCSQGRREIQTQPRQGCNQYQCFM